MYYALCFVGGFTVAYTIAVVRWRLSETRLIVDFGNTFGLKYSPDWDIFKRKAFAMKLIVRISAELRGSKTGHELIEEQQEKLREEWRKLE